MKPVFALSLALALALGPVDAPAQDELRQASSYAGLKTRAIKSLSEADIDELRRGGGWSLALAAELNGVPGPAHLLELRDEIPLTVDQVAALQTIFSQMQAEAIAAGGRLIAAEQAIEAAFRAADLGDARLRSLIAEAEAARAALRFTHLSRHLSTRTLLTEGQIVRYNALRGYCPDSCANAAGGADADVWRHHNSGG